MTEYIIIGCGAFGLHTALNLREIEPNSIIQIFDKNIKLSSTNIATNGIIFSKKEIDKNNFITFNSNKYDKMLYIHKIKNLEWFIIHFYNYIFNQKYIQHIIKQISIKTDNYCNNIESDYNSYNYWDNLIIECKNKNINIIDNTEIINYSKDNKKIIVSSKNNNYKCDKLILCTSTNLSLIYNKCYHKYIEKFSGLGGIIKVVNKPSCFYFKDGIFFTPYKDDLVKISMHLEIGYDKGNYEITKDNSEEEYNKIIEYLKNNKEIQNLKLVNVEILWRGLRAMSYDTIPFFAKVDDNVYWITGGSYLGTHLSNRFSEWFSDYILNKELKNVPDNFDPTINRFIKMRYKFYLIIIILLILIIIMLFLNNT
jgi:glycine/D-amino acid oxidase-like deaminating enzyme